MRKRIMITTAALLVLGVGIAMGVKKTSRVANPWADNIEALCDPENTPCISGGPHAISCSIDATAGPIGAACSVTCESGHYACCTYNGCHCI